MKIQPTAVSPPQLGPGETATGLRPAAAGAIPAATVTVADGALPANKDKVAATVNPQELKSSVDAINRFLKVNSEVQFSIDNASGRSVIKVVDTESQKVLLQFPSEQALEIGKDLSTLKGLLVNNKA